MTTVLCYGDSLTWGTDAVNGGRHAHEDLWPTALGAALGPAVRVVNAGLGGRTTMFDDHAAAADRNGARVLPTVLAMFEPAEVVVLMLGTNDLKPFVSGSAIAAAQGVKRLCEIVRTFPYSAMATPPSVVIVSPPRALQLQPTAGYPLMSPRTGEWSGLAPAYRQVASEAGARFFDAAEIASAEGGGDGIHLDAANTRAIGTALAPVVSELLKARAA